MPVAIVNESMAREWRGEDPLGKRFKLGAEDAPWVTVVGVIADVRQMGMDVPVKAEMYFPTARSLRTPGLGRATWSFALSTIRTPLSPRRGVKSMPSIRISQSQTSRRWRNC
jgi:hypothetical protein